MDAFPRVRLPRHGAPSVQYGLLVRRGDQLVISDLRFIENRVEIGPRHAEAGRKFQWLAWGVILLLKEFSSLPQNLPPSRQWQTSNVLEKILTTTIMTPIDPASNPHQETNEITRHTFMKKYALTVRAVTILGQRSGFALSANTSGCSHTWDENGGVEQSAGKCKAYQECTKCGRQDTWSSPYWPASSNKGWVPCKCGGTNELGVGCAWAPR